LSLSSIAHLLLFSVDEFYHFNWPIKVMSIICAGVTMTTHHLIERSALNEILQSRQLRRKNRYTIRFRVKCVMHFKYFPFDILPLKLIKSRETTKPFVFCLFRYSMFRCLHFLEKYLSDKSSKLPKRSGTIFLHSIISECAHLLTLPSSFGAHERIFKPCFSGFWVKEKSMSSG